MNNCTTTCEACDELTPLMKSSGFQDDKLNAENRREDDIIFHRVRKEYGNSNKFNRCPVCTPFKSGRVNHKHHSTRYLHNILRTEGLSQVECPTCKNIHPIEETQNKISIILSTSTLHNTFLHTKVKTPIHIDVETIPGGNIEDLMSVWKHHYWLERKPMNIVLAAGLNDIPHLTENQIMNLFYSFKKQVNYQNHENKLIIARLLRPPKLAWFEKNGPEPTFGGFRKYTNYIEKINNLNGYIDEMNSTYTLKYTLGFQTEGIRTLTKLDTEGKKTKHSQHQFTAWREYPNKHLCLHLNEDKRAALFMKTANFIKNNLI